MPTQLYDFRSAITELIHWMQVWMERERAVTQAWMGRDATEDWADVMVQALWLLNLAGVANSGVHESMKLRVLMQMREVAHGKKDPIEALIEMKEWEHGQAD